MGDTQEWWIWARYRDWPYQRETGSQKCLRTRVKGRFLHESGREKSPRHGNHFFSGKSTTPDSIMRLREARSRLNEPKR